MRAVNYFGFLLAAALTFGSAQASVLVSSDGAWSTNGINSMSNNGMQTNSHNGGTFSQWGGASFNVNAETQYLDMQAPTQVYTAGYTYSYKASAAAAQESMMTNQVVTLLADGAPVVASRGPNTLGTFGAENRNSIWGYRTIETGDPLIGQTIGLRLSSEGSQSRFRADGDSHLRATLTSHAGFNSELPSGHAAAGTLFDTEFELDSGGLVTTANPVGMAVAAGSELIITNSTDSYFRMNLNSEGARNRFELEASGESFQAQTTYRLSFLARKIIENDLSQNEINIILGDAYTNTLTVSTAATFYSFTVNADELALAGNNFTIEFVPEGAAVTNSVNQYRIYNLAVSAESLAAGAGHLYQTFFETNSIGLVASDYILDMAFSGTGRFDQDAGSNCYVLGSTESLSVTAADDTFRPGTAYKVAFHARGASPVTVSAGTFTSDVETGGEFEEYSLIIDADSVGISGERLSLTLEGSGVSETVIRSLKLSAVSQDIGCWFEDSNLGSNGGIPPDFFSRYDAANVPSWTNSLETMEVYYLRYATYRDWLKTNSVMKTRMAEVFNQYGIKVALDDTEPTWGHAKYNYNTPNYQKSIDALQDLENHGWNLCAVGMQSVLSKPWRDGPYDMSWRILDIVEYIKQVKPHFPDLEYGVIDAMPAKGWEYKSHYSALKNAVEDAGLTLDFIEQDFPIDFAITGSRTYEEMVEAEHFARFALGWKSGLYLTSSRGGQTSDELWRSDVISGLDQYLVAGAAPERITLAAWYPHPVYTAPDETDPALNSNGSTMLGTFLLMDEKLAEHGYVDAPDPGPATPSIPPNVVIFFVDDFGWADMEAHPDWFPHGSPLYETPSMHRLAEEGMRFSQAYAQPLCSASRAALLSGQYSAERHMLHLAIVNGSSPDPVLPTTSGPTRAYNYPQDRDHLPLEVETIAERLRAAGYATWHAGKWHLSPGEGGSNPNPASMYYPVQQGFDQQLGVGGPSPGSNFFGPFDGIASLVDHTGAPAPGTSRDYVTDHMAGLTIDLIDHHRANSPDQPFFLYYPSYGVHSPHNAKASVYNRYAAKLAGLPESKHRHPVFAAKVEQVDQELGRLLDHLDTTGLSSNTLFFFISDNGGLFHEKASGLIRDDIGADGIPDDDPSNVFDGTYTDTVAPISADTRVTVNTPLRGSKGSLWEGGMRVPFMVRYPGVIPAGASNSVPIHLVDVYQTILDYTPATAKPDYPLDGQSLKPELEQNGNLPGRDLFVFFPRSTTTWDDEVGGAYPGGMAVIAPDYKMIARYSTAHDAATEQYQLFRTTGDLGEEVDLAAQLPEVVDAMRSRMNAWTDTVAAPVPTRNPNYNGTSFDDPESSFSEYLAEAGINPQSADGWKYADPDGDLRNNEAEFLQQTDPGLADDPSRTVWIRDGEKRFAFPARMDQSLFSVVDTNGVDFLSPRSGLELDAQYDGLFVYKPTTPVGTNNQYDIIFTPPVAHTNGRFTISYLGLPTAASGMASDAAMVNLDQPVGINFGSGVELISQVQVTTTAVGSNFRGAGGYGLAVVSGNNQRLEPGESVGLTFEMLTESGTPVTNITIHLADAGARAPAGTSIDLSVSGSSTSAVWIDADNADTPADSLGALAVPVDAPLQVESVSGWSQLSYLSFDLFIPRDESIDTDGDLLSDVVEEQLGLNAWDPADGNADHDGDGHSLGQEHIAGTSDDDANDVLKASVVSLGASMRISFPAKDGRGYRIWKRSELVSDNNWLPVHDFGVVAGDQTLTHDDPVSDLVFFYRLEVYLP